VHVEHRHHDHAARAVDGVRQADLPADHGFLLAAAPGEPALVVRTTMPRDQRRQRDADGSRHRP
jgi:hypothetical protein